MDINLLWKRFVSVGTNRSVLEMPDIDKPTYSEEH